MERKDIFGSIALLLGVFLLITVFYNQTINRYFYLLSSLLFAFAGAKTLNSSDEELKEYYPKKNKKYALGNFAFASVILILILRSLFLPGESIFGFGSLILFSIGIYYGTVLYLGVE